MYKHCEVDNENITLHDSHATSIMYENGSLSFVFHDGFLILERHPDNMVDKTVRTDKAAVMFCLDGEDEDDYDITVYVFKEKYKKTVREEWPLSKLIDYVNNNKFTIEFLYQYKGYNSMIIECELCSDKKPYYRECELKILYSDVKYYWSNL